MANLSGVPQFGFGSDVPFEDEPFVVNAKRRQGMSVPSEPMPIDLSPPTQEDINQASNIPSALSQAANPDYYQNILAKMNSPEYQALQKELRDRSQQAIDSQAAGVAQNEKDLNDLKSKGQSINWAPAISFVNSQTGSKIDQGYQSENPDEYKQKVMGLQNALQAQRQGLSKSQIDAIKDQLNMMNPLKNMAPLARLDQRGQMIGLREDAQAAQAAKDVHNHPLIQQTSKQLGQLAIDKHTIETSPIVTPQILREISNGIARALAGGSQVGLESSNMQDLSTSQTHLAALEQKLLNAPIEGASPAIKQQVVDTLNRLEQAYGKYQQNIAQRITVGKSYNHNKQAQHAQATAVGQYNYTPPEETSGMKVGTVEDGHRFKGGNPGDPKNWEVVK